MRNFYLSFAIEIIFFLNFIKDNEKIRLESSLIILNTFSVNEPFLSVSMDSRDEFWSSSFKRPDTLQICITKLYLHFVVTKLHDFRSQIINNAKKINYVQQDNLKIKHKQISLCLIKCVFHFLCTKNNNRSLIMS